MTTATAELEPAMEKDKGIYIRQKTLNLKLPKSVVVIGVGGVGSHVALDLALDGVPRIMIIDYDIVEESNRNRTMFTSLHEGMLKVDAVCDLIAERRRTEVVPITERIENLDPDLLDDYELVVDCRDISDPLPDKIMKKVKIIGGYNGSKITIHINPSGTKLWGKGQSSYSIIPSWGVPPQLISAIIRSYILTGKLRKKEYIKHFDVSTLIKTILELKEEGGD